MAKGKKTMKIGQISRYHPELTEVFNEHGDLCDVIIPASSGYTLMRKSSKLGWSGKLTSLVISKCGIIYSYSA